VIAIIDYGLGNLRSVKYALDRLGVPSELTDQARVLEEAQAVILPGVGAFGEAMENLRQLKLVEPIRRVASEKPFIGICLGMQLLFSTSQEHGLHQGLGIVPGEVVRFDSNLTVPHMGWNQVEQAGQSPLFEDIADQAYFYFAHSYFCRPANPAAAIGMTEYGSQYASTVQAGLVFGAQYHPEKSGPVGLKMLANFCKLAKNGNK
jgi:glutamine amidotransferase